ncbi:MAG: hypothetical protein AB1847_07935 [bacterium]
MSKKMEPVALFLPRISHPWAVFYKYFFQQLDPRPARHTKKEQGGILLLALYQARY